MALLRPQGPIYQTIDAKRLRAKNQETAPFFSSVTAALTPTSPSAVAVQFKTFRLLGAFRSSACGRGSDFSCLRCLSVCAWLAASTALWLDGATLAGTVSRAEPAGGAGVIPVTAPEAARGALDTTYVDDELRVSRGDKGNLFVLLQRDPSARLDDAAFEASFALAPVPLVTDEVKNFR
jgi:hypothetical protein